jgi:hypothetical protein
VTTATASAISSARPPAGAVPSADAGCPASTANGVENWDLPGPSAFLAGVADAVARGAHPMLTVPRHGMPAGLLRRVRRFNLHLYIRCIKTIVISPDGPEVIRQILAAVGEPMPDRPFLPSDLMSSSSLAEQLLVVDARLAGEHQREDLRWLLDAAAAVTHACGESRRSPRLLAVLPAPAPGRPASSRAGSKLSEHWWWGQCGFLDTNLVVRRHGDRRDALTKTSIVHVAGYDLELAALLAQSWDGRIPSLRELLETYARAHPELAKAHTDDDLAPAAGRPAVHGLAAWSAGSLDRWDDRLFPHPCAHLDDPARLAALLRRAQVGHIMPMLDDWRRRLLRWLAAQGHELDPNRDRPWELTEICDYMDGVHRFRRSPQFVLARRLRRVRNQVAHLKVVDRHVIDELDELAARIDLTAPPRSDRGNQFETARRQAYGI